MAASNEGVNKPEQPIVPAPEAGPAAVPEIESSPEGERTPESSREGSESTASKDEMVSEPAVQVAVAKTTVPASELARDPLLIEVENKLSDGLWDAYKSMDPGLRARFKAEGERIAAVARDGIVSGRLATEKILDMIVKWLRMIPRVDRWFLVQDAKLKTDAIVRMSEQKDAQQQ